MAEELVWNDPTIAPEVARRIGVPDWLGPRHAASFHVDGKLRGAAVFDSFNDFDCAIHLYIEPDTQIPPWVFTAIFTYPFTQLKLKRVTAMIREDNEPALRLAFRNGFEIEGRKRWGAGDAHELILGLLASDCEHLK